VVKHCVGCPLRDRNKDDQDASECIKRMEPIAIADPLGVVVDRRYPYHVVVCIGVVMHVFRSRSASEARDVAECHGGQFWRFPPDERYPGLMVCDFGCEEYHQIETTETRRT